jgi:hypothetical protein
MVTWLDDQSFPSRFDDTDELDAFLSRPSRALVADLAAIDGDIIVLGVLTSVLICHRRRS